MKKLVFVIALVMIGTSCASSKKAKKCDCPQEKPLKRKKTSREYK